MCGIVGYNGRQNATEILMQNLSKLEYRGYDSAGIAVVNAQNKIEVQKSKGALASLQDKLKKFPLFGSVGIGHTRWATHGAPTETNAHPHFSDDLSVALVHNGIIENHAELREKLEKHGYVFYSQTDTEVLAKLVHYYKNKYGSPMDALARVSIRATGSFACCILFDSQPDTMYCIKKESPLVVGVSDGESFVASDALAISSNAKEVFFVDNFEIVQVKKGECKFFTLDQEPKQKTPTKIDLDGYCSCKNGYPHFMLKEIYEQPEVAERVLSRYIKNGEVNFLSAGIDQSFAHDAKHISIVACGSAYHAGLSAKQTIESLCGVRVSVELASEFRYRNPILDKDDLVVLVSQSGETADTLAALREAKQRGAKTLAVVNVRGSAIAREAHKTILTFAGTEIAVATTKAYVAQVLVLQLFGLFFAKNNPNFKKSTQKSYILALLDIPKKMQSLLSNSSILQKLACVHSHHKDAYFLGRGIDFATAQEASLKLKEISYMHTEAYAAGELKHGSISLVEDGTLVVGILTNPALAEKTLSNLVEAKSRGAYIVAITNLESSKIKNVADEVVFVPHCLPMFSTFLSIVPLQLFAYYVALSRGLDIDKPRNLAKSVTVE